MNDRPSTEARIAALIVAYADQAPTRVEPAAMARLAASSAGGRDGGWGFLRHLDRGLAVLLVVGTLIVALLAGMVAVGAGPWRRDATDLLTSRASVAPFVGLPPVGAPPSEPESGELVVGFGARMSALVMERYSMSMEHYRVWLYEDGRLIWTSGRGAGGRTLPDAVVEQRLTAEGVALVRAEVEANIVRIMGPSSLADGRVAWGRPGVLWGNMTVGRGDRLLDVSWDGRLPGELADPASWLPASAWADARIHGYVPSHYAVCAWTPSDTEESTAESAVDRLPESVLALVQAGGVGTADEHCREVPTDTARSIAAMLAAAGWRPDGMGVGPRYELRTVRAPSRSVTMEILPMTPHGEIVCDCG